MQAGLEKKKEKKKREAFRVLSDQIETWGERELEDCNVEGRLKGGMLKGWKKKKNVEVFRWENREFESYPPSCSTVSQ